MELRLDVTPDELPVFLAEVEEILQRLDEQLVRLEQEGPGPELLQEVFRSAHTIKGSSAAIGHTRMAGLTHAMETLLDRVRQGQLEVGPALTDHLFVSLDMLRTLAGEVETRRQSDVDVDELVGALEGLAATTSPPAEAHTATRTDREATPDGATHHVLLQLEDSTWAAVRSLQALMALEEAGEVLVSRPSRAEIERQQVGERLSVFVRTERSVDELRDVLSDIPELAVLSLDEVGEAANATEIDEAAADLAAAESSVPVGGPAETSADGGAGRVPDRKATTTVRIDVERLDHLLNLVGELVIDRTRLVGLGRALVEQFGEHDLFGQIAETTFHLGRLTDELQAEVMKSRMLPIGTVFSRFPRVVRDLATRQSKHVELIIEGRETELDRSVIEEIGDPLVHLVRNAIDHGVEPPADRVARGKPEQATVRLAAEHVDSSIVITVKDDGRGIDASKVRARAVERGLLSPEAAARMSEAEAVELIFAPGFSTATEITDISGRGVGMDIVRANVEKLGGSVEVHTVLGEGSRFVLRLPLTLAIVQALLVRVGNGIYALPLTSVTETLRVSTTDIQRIQQGEAIVLRGRLLPIVRLSRLFRCRSGATDERKDILVVAVKVGERQVGLAVDGLLGEQEVVIKSLGPLVGDVPGISSATILGDGTVALIVDVPALVQKAATDRHDRRSADARDVATPTLARTA